MGDADPRPRTWLIPALAVAAAAALLLAPLPARWGLGWRGELLDLGHVPLFAALTLALWARLGPSVMRPALAAVALAGLAELAQWPVGRSASWSDFLYGALGALAAAAGVRAWQARRAWPRAAGYGLLAAGFLAWPLIDSGPRLLDVAEGHADFPTLAAFRTDRELRRWERTQAVLTRVPDPARPGGWAGKLDLMPGPEDYPSGALEPVVGDFRGFRWLCCSFAVEGEPLELVVSVRSGVGRERHTTHFQTGRVYDPGKHVVRLDLPAIAAKARPHPLDLADVRYVQFFVVRPGVVRTVYLQGVWLEP